MVILPDMVVMCVLMVCVRVCSDNECVCVCVEGRGHM